MTDSTSSEGKFSIHKLQNNPAVTSQFINLSVCKSGKFKLSEKKNKTLVQNVFPMIGKCNGNKDKHGATVVSIKRERVRGRERERGEMKRRRKTTKAFIALFWMSEIRLKR